jgi:hypothetical protein
MEKKTGAKRILRLRAGQEISGRSPDDESLYAHAAWSALAASGAILLVDPLLVVLLRIATEHFGVFGLVNASGLDAGLASSFVFVTHRRLFRDLPKAMLVTTQRQELVD